jgi:hypothetical protein
VNFSSSSNFFVIPRFALNSALFSIAIFLGFISAFIPISSVFSIDSSDPYPTSKLKIAVSIIFSISLESRT